MRILLRALAGCLLVAGVAALVWLTIENGELEADVLQLEAELGQMTIEDEDRVYVVAIEEPRVAPEVLAQVDRIWQFRCYMPAGYDFQNHRIRGHVGEGIYASGGGGSGWSSPNAEPRHELLTVSMKQVGDRIEFFYCSGVSSGTSSWRRGGTQLSDDALVVETLVGAGEPAKSFDQDTILPFLKIYDPSRPKPATVMGKDIEVYPGALFLICPTSRKDDFESLKKGIVPKEFQPEWLARGERREE